MEETQFKEISDKLDIVIKLLAVNAVGDKTGREAIACLDKVGVRPKEIANIVGTTRHTVDVALNIIRKKNRKKINKKKNK